MMTNKWVLWAAAIIVVVLGIWLWSGMFSGPKAGQQASVGNTMQDSSDAGIAQVAAAVDSQITTASGAVAALNKSSTGASINGAASLINTIFGAETSMSGALRAR